MTVLFTSTKNIRKQSKIDHDNAVNINNKQKTVKLIMTMLLNAVKINKNTKNCVKLIIAMLLRSKTKKGNKQLKFHMTVLIKSKKTKNTE